jgi:hypothetical protein
MHNLSSEKNSSHPSALPSLSFVGLRFDICLFFHLPPFFFLFFVISFSFVFERIVEFDDERDVDEAIHQFDRKVVEGAEIEVTEVRAHVHYFFPSFHLIQRVMSKLCEHVLMPTLCLNS